MRKINYQIIRQEYKKLQVQILMKNHKYDILNISLQKDSVFPEHSSYTGVQLIAMEDVIVFHVNGESYHLKAHQHFSFPKQTEHWVEVKENSKFLAV